MKKRGQRVLTSLWFLGISLVGTSVAGVVYSIGSVSAQVALLGSFVSILSGLVVTFTQRTDSRTAELVDLVDGIAKQRTLFEHPNLLQHNECSLVSLSRIASRPHSVFQSLAAKELQRIQLATERLAEGELVFDDTEDWRNAYRQILTTTTDCREYRSVAWIKSLDYWQDTPGRRTTEVNLELARAGIKTSRIAIFRESVLGHSRQPLEPIRSWLDDQQHAGIRVFFVHENELATEQDLLVDIGIYGDEAVGLLDVGDESRTVCFRLSFDTQRIQLYNDLWSRLMLYARNYSAAG